VTGSHSTDKCSMIAISNVTNARGNSMGRTRSQALHPAALLEDCNHIERPLGNEIHFDAEYFEQHV
jgi:hypothetical protein